MYISCYNVPRDLVADSLRGLYVFLFGVFFVVWVGLMVALVDGWFSYRSSLFGSMTGWYVFSMFWFSRGWGWLKAWTLFDVVLFQKPERAWFRCDSENPKGPDY